MNALEKFVASNDIAAQKGGGAPRARLICLADVEPQAIQWLWPERIALGKLTVLSGDPGCGKSFLTCDIAARVTTGREWPDQRPSRLGGVLLLSAEDDCADTIVPRLIDARADRSRIHVVDGIEFTDDEGKKRQRELDLDELAVLRDAIERIRDCRLVVVDPVSAFLPEKNDGNNNVHVRRVLKPLAKLAAETGVAVILVHHLNKAAGGRAMYRGMGSLAFNAAARTVWYVAKDRDDPDRRLMLPVKNNIGPDNEGLAYRLEGSGGSLVVDWEAGNICTTADEALGADDGARREAPARDAAALFLAEKLLSGPKSWDELEADGVLSGHAKATLMGARPSVARNQREKSGRGRWFWHLRPLDDIAPHIRTPLQMMMKKGKGG